MKLKYCFLQKGQIGLIMVLILAIGLTVGLAIVSQSLTSISVTETEEKSIRAFNAAEAGIEEILKQSTITAGATNVNVGDLTAQVNVTSKNDQRITLEANETMEVPLAGGTATSVKISWVDKNDTLQNPGTCQEGEAQAPASIEVLRLKDVNGAIVPYRYLYNACAGLDAINGFTTSDPAIQAGTDPYLQEVNFTDIDGDEAHATHDVVLRIRVFYNKATVAVVAGNGELPIQEYQMVSTVTTNTGETKSVEVTKTVESWPDIFDYVLFSGSTLTK
ncbi:hypothetical protein A2160_06010 [Candidatus Beckwithbacteria bacterium RBG_13_42_9]|uniref:Type 4 fimbrial biogenesis protein PilX N-terminal domain-containing protein n=1 Tax=Candidatus Beckwithbacteria bacterium RBG_13_42_9 TaxID=1797457 RepID=A0A1F5E589_9BACT|nr:MAG: hypothetical protein A2160_06010 [Candidatus Beckwithbacteria bacterium RBG_13_42_9]